MKGRTQAQATEKWGDRADLGPGRAAERAEHAEIDIARTADHPREKYQQAQPGIGQSRDRETAEQEHGDRGAPFAGGDAIDYRSS